MAADRLEFGLLGPLEARRDDELLELGGMQRRALLAVLLLNANHVVSVDRLIDELWGESPPATAAHTIQVYVSQLRKLFGEEGAALATQRPGYVIRLEPEQLDLNRFEGLLAEGRDALGRTDPEAAAQKLHEALGLWRGPALADFGFEPFAEAAIARLEDLRLAALEDRIEADLLLGRHQEVIGELEELIAANPLRERLRAHLMLALYRAGRQAEALEAYQATRRVLVDELGIDPGARLQELERAILNQDPALDQAPRAEAAAPPTPERSILLVSRGEEDLAELLRLSEPLARSHSPHEVILARVVGDAAGLGNAASALAGRHEALVSQGIAARVAAFTSTEPAADLVRLASQQEVDLLLAEGALEGDLRTMLEEAPSDVAVLSGGGPGQEGGAVIVPFGAAEHDWAALELGVWFATARGARLRLLGATADPTGEKRDASRVLASASLVVQQLAGVVAEPVLVAGPDEIVGAADDAGVVILGLSERWRQEGMGEVRSDIVARSPAPVLLVRRGPRPGALTPREGLTRYTWSLAPPES
jgi:DNA-binding SARP family transcriptional activator